MFYKIFIILVPFLHPPPSASHNACVMFCWAARTKTHTWLQEQRMMGYISMISCGETSFEFSKLKKQHRNFFLHCTPDVAHPCTWSNLTTIINVIQLFLFSSPPPSLYVFTCICSFVIFINASFFCSSPPPSLVFLLPSYSLTPRP